MICTHTWFHMRFNVFFFIVVKEKKKEGKISARIFHRMQAKSIDS